MLNNQDGMSESSAEAISLGSILIVEDEILVSILIEELVREMGASHVTVVAEPGEALRVATDASFDGAILDVHLGKGTSVEVADMLASRGIPFLFSSALGSTAVAERHRHRPILAKPFADEELRAHLLGFVRR